MKKKTTLMIMLKNKNNNPVTDASKELNVCVVEDMKHHSLPVDVDIT